MEDRLNRFEKAMIDVQDTLIVMAEIQRRQSEVQKLQAQDVEFHRQQLAEHEKRMAHIDLTLTEITDKLNGMMGYLDNQRPH
jgi:hypothetical protein